MAILAIFWSLKLCLCSMCIAKSAWLPSLPFMKGSHADCALHIEWRHSFRDKKKAKIAVSANFRIVFFKTTYLLGKGAKKKLESVDFTDIFRIKVIHLKFKQSIFFLQLYLLCNILLCGNVVLFCSHNIVRRLAVSEGRV